MFNDLQRRVDFPNPITLENFLKYENLSNVNT